MHGPLHLMAIAPHTKQVLLAPLGTFDDNQGFDVLHALRMYYKLGHNSSVWSLCLLKNFILMHYCVYRDCHLPGSPNTFNIDKGMAFPFLVNRAL
jgi:hypothetical protein